MSDKWTIAERFGANVARYKREKGLSQSDIARRAQIHRTHISLLIRGKRVAQIDTVVKLASALEVSPGALFEGTGWHVGEEPQHSGHFEIRKPRAGETSTDDEGADAAG